MQNNFPFDKIIVKPSDIDLKYSPLRRNLKSDTYVLGAFNPGMTRLSNNNILIMVRIAEALKTPIYDNKIHSIRWDPSNAYVLDGYNIDDVEMSDPRSFSLKKYFPIVVDALTSISWLLPIELTFDGKEIIKIHYDKIISPSKSYQEYGIEDARISLINGKYLMTTCSVSSERQSTTLYSSENGLDYFLEGIILDHQNKDIILFEGLINNKFYALTRPLGISYLSTPPESNFNPGPSINLAESPDALHWKPLDKPLIRSGKGKSFSLKLGGGAQPILTPKGWFVLFHGVEKNGEIGIYRTYWALLDKNKPWKILFLDTKNPVMTSKTILTEHLSDDI